ncbi:unnamed protein product, partial [Mesorhabditis belari]|uniref:RUN and TBC1 domain-containing protein 3 n=1 Tax=Mesorhabditis belari TaxID=2138241 RepID=A0AAF3EZZ9_9BILA
MAKYKKGKDAKNAETVVDDEEEEDGPPIARKICDTTKEIDQPIHYSHFSLSGKPFSAMNKEFIPTYIEDPKEYFDEFGFRSIDESPFRDNSPIEDSSEKMKWIAHLEFAHNESQELKWSKINVEKIKGEKMEAMIKHSGIPHSMRPFLWPRLIGAYEKEKAAGYSYLDVLRQSAKDNPTVGVQIERDLLRTLPNNICFWKKNSPGIDALRRLLKSIAYIYPDLGYCQGMGVVVANLLLYCSEETTFWMMAALIEEILPPNYYSQSLLGLQADERVTRHLMKTHVPDLHKALEDYDVEISLVTVNWLLTLFASVLKTRILLRVWDLIFYTGGVTIFRTIISALKMREDEIVELANSTKSSADIFNAISQLPSKIDNLDSLLEYMSSFEYTITEHLVAELRKKHQAIIMADSGMIVNTNTDTNLPKQKMQRRKLTRSKSIISQIFNSKEKGEDPKTKNIRQTEILIDLKESILQICRYFMQCDENMELNITTQADYTPESHTHDLERFHADVRKGRKRARALLDFARQDEDELGFRKNDIITIICEKNEDCWVGEVNGLRGWFPAKFVEIVDEGNKNYTVYGDEVISPEITEYIRGRLANAFRQVMEHGIRENNLYPTTPFHPWSFIEDIAYYSVQKHYNAVYSRLTLCSTFRLDQDGKLLSPEELLFRSVQEVNDTHNAVNAHQDVKLRSLLVMGVNEQCLHLWFELLCGSVKQEEIRKKFYHSWAFIRTPAWRQIKCDLRLLSQFAFKLSPLFEIDGFETKKKKTGAGVLSSTKKKIMNSVTSPSEKKVFGEEPLREGVRDMLIKHHLFSWDL